MSNTEFPAYLPGPFAGVYEAHRPLAELVWKLSNTPEVIARLKMVTELKHPAIAAVETPLRDLVGVDALYDDGVRRMVGHMLSQVMSRLGFEVEKSGVKVRDTRDDDEKARLKALFSVGTRYRRRQLVENEAKLVDYALAAGDLRMAEEIRRDAAKARADFAAEKAR